jgi:hypothetical protein
MGSFHHLAQYLPGTVEVDASMAPAHRCAGGPRHAEADVLDRADPERRFGERTGRGQLVEFLAGAALQVDQAELARPRELNYRETVRGGVSQCDKPV